MKDLKKQLNQIIISNAKKIYSLLIILLALPSIIYYVKGKSLYGFEKLYENTFFLNRYNNTLQTISFLILLILIVIFYGILLKYRKKIFKDIKEIFIFIALISVIFTVITPFLSSDIFYYLGTGRLASVYKQNPYYVTMYNFRKLRKQCNDISIYKDKAFLAGYCNYWTDTTVVYGPYWTMICTILGLLSFGKINFGIFLFKIVALVAHLINCYLLYKISNKKKMFVLMYGLNPFILLKGVGQGHNDIVLLMFLLMAVYFLFKKKLKTSLLLLSVSVNIKFITILFVPFFILYFYRDKNIKERILKCIKYGIFFVILYIIPYLLYIRDFSVFTCMFVQRERYVHSWYVLLQSDANVGLLKTISLGIFAFLYCIKCLKLLFTEKIIWKNEMTSIYYFLFYFIFVLLTNCQPWYLMWLFMILIWQKPFQIRNILGIFNVFLIAKVVYIWRYMIWYIAVIWIGVFAVIYINYVNKIFKFIRSKI